MPDVLHHFSLNQLPHFRRARGLARLGLGGLDLSDGCAQISQFRPQCSDRLLKSLSPSSRVGIPKEDCEVECWQEGTNNLCGDLTLTNVIIDAFSAECSLRCAMR